MAWPGVVGMAVGDHGALDRPNGVDMEAAGLASQAGSDGHQDVLRAHLRYIGDIAAFFTSPQRERSPRRSAAKAWRVRVLALSIDLKSSPGSPLRVSPTSPLSGRGAPRIEHRANARALV